jgi:hypothetical protein
MLVRCRRYDLQLLLDGSAKVVRRKGTGLLEGDGADVTIESFVQKVPKKLEMAEIKLDPMETQVLNVVSACPLLQVLRVLASLYASFVDDSFEILDVPGDCLLPKLDDADLVVVRLGVFLTSLNEVFVGSQDVRVAGMDGESTQVPVADERIASEDKGNARSCDWGFDDGRWARRRVESVVVPIR